jgi:hypothetical protein
MTDQLKKLPDGVAWRQFAAGYALDENGCDGEAENNGAIEVEVGDRCRSWLRIVDFLREFRVSIHNALLLFVRPAAHLQGMIPAVARRWQPVRP